MKRVVVALLMVLAAGCSYTRDRDSRSRDCVVQCDQCNKLKVECSIKGTDDKAKGDLIP